MNTPNLSLVSGRAKTASSISFTPRFKATAALIAGTVAMLALTSAPLSGAVILQADFNGSGSGTGGVSDIVTSGGTAVLYSYSGSSVTAAVSTANPFSAVSGGYLSISDPTTNTHFAGAGVTISPTTSANSFDGTYSTGSTFNSVNGAVDLFFRVSDVSALVANSLRFFDVNGVNGGMRMTLLQATATTMRFELTSKNSSGTIIGNATTPNGTVSFTANTLYHLAATYTTDGSGKVTTKLYFAAGNTAIDTTTTTHLIATATSTGVFDPLVTDHSFNSAGSFSMGLISNGADSKILDIDQFRIYNDAPAAFTSLPTSIPEPSTTALLISGAAAGVALVSRKRN